MTTRPQPARTAASPGVDRARAPAKPPVYRHADHPGIGRPEVYRARESSHPSKY